MSTVSTLAPSITGTHECWATVSGHRMRYLRAGSGPPLLLIPGLLAYSFSWRFTIPGLSDIRTVFAPDLLGTGFSDRSPDIDCSAQACAQRMLRFMDEVGIERTDLVGTSHGGGVATLMATIAPGRIRKLVLVAPVNPWSAHGQWITRLLATRLGRVAFQNSYPAIEAFSSFWLSRLYGDTRRIPPGTLEGYKAPLTIKGTLKYGLDIVRCWHSDLNKLQDAYPRVSSPTLLIWGDRDIAVYPSSAQEILKRIPGARLEMFEGVGHLTYEEVPEAFNQALRKFLQ